MRETESILKESGINPTPVRILIYKCLSSSVMPISLSEIEFRLDSVDKSSISRTLTTFKKYHLIHTINDGSGSVKYEICRAHNHENDDDMHVHFRCNKCGTTVCFPDIPIPEVKLPSKYEIQELSFMITGICPQCSGVKNKINE